MTLKLKSKFENENDPKIEIKGQKIRHRYDIPNGHIFFYASLQVVVLIIAFVIFSVGNYNFNLF